MPQGTKSKKSAYQVSIPKKKKQKKGKSKKK